MGEKFNPGEYLSYKIKQDLVTFAGELIVIRFDFTQGKILGVQYSPTQDEVNIQLGFDYKSLFMTREEEIKERIKNKVKWDKIEERAKLKGDNLKEYYYSELLVGVLNPSGYSILKPEWEYSCIQPSVQSEVYIESRCLMEDDPDNLKDVFIQLDRTKGNLEYQNLGKNKFPIFSDSELKRADNFPYGYRFYRANNVRGLNFDPWTNTQGRLLDIVIGNNKAIPYLKWATGNNKLKALTSKNPMNELYGILLE